jgi:iron(III) transport system ATP-binding protein
VDAEDRAVRLARAAKAVRAEGLWKVFAGRCETVTAVEDVWLTVEPGELLTLLGPSGCGKTTVLRMIAGLETPTRGEVFIGDARATDLPANRRRVGMVFQSYALFPHLTVFENAAYALRLRRRPTREVEGAVRPILSMLGLEGHAARLPARLSGGEQQRVALARALVAEPDVLLFDEPLSNLDARLRLQVRGEIRRIQRLLRITAVFVTHDQSEAMSLSDRIAIMSAGRLVQVGRPQEIYRRPANRFVADFVGRASFLPATVAMVAADRLSLECLGAKLEVQSWNGSPVNGESVDLVVRPEAIRLVSPAEAAVVGTVRRAEYQGAVAECYVTVAEHSLLALADSDERGGVPAEGERVGLQFRPGSLHAISGAAKGVLG